MAANSDEVAVTDLDKVAVTDLWSLGLRDEVDVTDLRSWILWAAAFQKIRGRA